MKKIGIITTFRQPNWGSVLQAYATQKAVESLGYKAQVIDYVYPNNYHIERGYWHPTHIPIKRRIAIWLGIVPPTKMMLLNDFIKKEMNVSKKIDSREELKDIANDYDIFLSGSDQIWNPNTMYGDMSYMFDFTPASAKRISYASSFSCSFIPKEYIDQYKSNLNRMHAISVREQNGADLVKQLIGKDAKVVLDPTLLLDKAQWSELGEKSYGLDLPKRYIVCYMLGYTYSPDEAMSRLLSRIQKDLELPVLFLGKKPKGFKGDTIVLPKRKDIGIYDFLYIIKNAECVVTSSFHGTAFSLNFGVPFLALTDGASNSDDRISSILNKMNMQDKLVTTASPIEIMNINYEYDAEKEQSKLESLRKDSLEFLAESLK